MATTVAQLAIGHSHTYHGGLIPTHVAWLSVNDRPAWILTPAGYLPDQDPNLMANEHRVWVPSSWDNLIEDGLLLLHTHVLIDQEVFHVIADHFRELVEETFVDLTKCDPKALQVARDTARDGDWNYKLVFSIFEGINIEEQLPILDDYATQLVVCRPTYSRTQAGFGGVEVRGTLAPPGRD